MLGEPIFGGIKELNLDMFSIILVYKVVYRVFMILYPFNISTYTLYFKSNAYYSHL